MMTFGSAMQRLQRADLTTTDVSSTLILTEHHGAASWLPPEHSRLGAFWWIRYRFPFIGNFLQAAAITPLEISVGSLDGVIGWGDRLQAHLARRYAATRGCPYWTLEDGFFRSVGLGKTKAPPVSILADDLGPHFGAAQPSRLEWLLQTHSFRAGASRARSVRELIVRQRLTKYNHLPDRPLHLQLSPRRRRILLVDQVRGDASIAASGATADTFLTMWRDALTQDATVIVKIHPDVSAGLARGYLAPLARDKADVCIIADDCSPHAVLDIVDEVWTVSSQLGFDALMRDIPVVTYAAPAYAGWGLTEDRAQSTIARAALTRRQRKLSLDDYVAAAVLHYPLYLDPVTEQRTPAEQALERLIAWRQRARGLSGTYLCLGFSRHKRKVARLYLNSPSSQVKFVRRAALTRVKAGSSVVVWSSRVPETDVASFVTQGCPVIRVEDGFLRSSGLGSNLISPSSLCFDPIGIYFDGNRPSTLEQLLNSTQFDPAILARAIRLRVMILDAGLTKYNLPIVETFDYRRLAQGRPIITVAAQVPGDASLQHGQPCHSSSLDLLAAVRRARPDDFIIYKQHPDVLAGRRGNDAINSETTCHADLVVGNVALETLLAASDEVHVATSQLGFEALLRGRNVFCHGLPFYAGWGLTRDSVSSARRRRTLSLEELVAGALILYPTYVSWRTQLPCEVEDVVRELAFRNTTQQDHLRSPDLCLSGMKYP